MLLPKQSFAGTSVSSTAAAPGSAGDPSAPWRVVVVFGTRPEAIKLAPVIRALGQRESRFTAVNICTSQHQELIRPLLGLFDIRVDHDLEVMSPGQTLNGLSARLLERLEPVLHRTQPDLVLVQGDTSTTLAGALAAFHRGIPVGHVEAGLRSGDVRSPFPEEMNRVLVTRLASLHFAPTERNAQLLRNEGVPPQRIFVTGNPGVDALEWMRTECQDGSRSARLLDRARRRHLVVATLHRRENHARIPAYLRALRRFVESHPDILLVFSLHPNPAVSEPALQQLSGHSRILLEAPFDYPDFLQLASHAWLVVSDSGGIQEEAPSLGTRLLIARDTTERPEVVEEGLAQLVGADPARLSELLELAYRERFKGSTLRNPFGDGFAARRICDAIEQFMASPV